MGIFTNAGVYSINISKNGNTIVAGLQDGLFDGIGWITGKEFYALFPHRNGIDWVAWTPPGFYVSSADGDQYIGWHINKTTDSVARFYSAWQFERILYRPDIVERYFLSRGEWSESGLESEYRQNTMTENAPPELAIEVHDSDSVSRVTLSIEAEKNVLPISHYSVFVNDLPVVPYASRDVKGEEANVLRPNP